MPSPVKTITNNQGNEHTYHPKFSCASRNSSFKTLMPLVVALWPCWGLELLPGQCKPVLFLPAFKWLPLLSWEASLHMHVAWSNFASDSENPDTPLPLPAALSPLVLALASLNSRLCSNPQTLVCLHCVWEPSPGGVGARS